MATYRLSERDAKRVDNCVNAYERAPRGPAYHRTRTPQVMQSPSWRYGVVDATIAAGGHGNVSIWELNAVGAWADTNEDQDSYATFMLATGSIAAGKRCLISYHQQAERWEIIEWQC